MFSLILAASVAFAADIKFLSSSAVSTVPIETILTGNPTPFAQPLRNLKVSLVFEKPAPIARVHLESCQKDWNDGVQVFASPGLQRVFTEGGKGKFDLKLTPPLQSLSIVFGHDQEMCLRNLKVFDASDKPVELVAHETLPAKVSVPLLFDQHSDSVAALEDAMTITFEKPQTFDRAIVWTGASPLYAHSLKMNSGAKWSETLPLRNSSSDQEVIFKKPFTGSVMTVVAPDAGFISELRFASGTKVGVIRAVNSVSRVFEDSGFTRTLDYDWATGDTESDKWTLILRQDGTFFIRGYNDDQSQAHDYSALGAYVVTREEKGKLRLKINGVRFPTALSWDGISCPFACGNEGSMERASQITDSLVLEKLDEGSMFLRNRTPRAQRTLPFGDLKFHRAVDE